MHVDIMGCIVGGRAKIELLIMHVTVIIVVCQNAPEPNVCGAISFSYRW